MTSKQGSAIDVLRFEQDKVLALLDKYPSSGNLEEQQKESEVANLVHHFNILAEMELAVLYPAVADKCDEGLVDRFVECHNHIKVLTAGVQRMVGDDEGYDEQVAELIAAMQKHIKEEEQQLFPALERCEIDFDALGKKLAESRDALISG